MTVSIECWWAVNTVYSVFSNTPTMPLITPCSINFKRSIFFFLLKERLLGLEFSSVNYPRLVFLNQTKSQCRCNKEEIEGIILSNFFVSYAHHFAKQRARKRKCCTICLGHYMSADVEIFFFLWPVLRHSGCH